jgi:AcrR family transcriptional regulator
VPVKGDAGHPDRQRRTQADRRQATRSALLTAGRELFAAKGFAGAGREEIVERAGVTRGALYHHFSSKEDLFRAVYEQLEDEVLTAVATSALAATSPLEQLRRGARAYLDAVAADPAVRRICLLDAPSVLPAEALRDMAERHGLGLIRGTLAAAMAAGELAERPLEPLARLLRAALMEAAILVAEGADGDETAAIVDGMIDRL